MRKIKTIFTVAFILFSYLNAGSQTLNNTSFQTADSFYSANDWNKAAGLYQHLLKDTSTNSIEWQRLGFCYYNLGKTNEALKSFEKSEANNPPTPMQPYLYSRMAKAYGTENNNEKTMIYLQKAVDAGYLNLKELDTAKEFSALQNDENFKMLRIKVYNILYPCYTNAHAREFDFWAGEWNVYVTGTKYYTGHSLVQIISGGCALLENWDSPNSSGKSINFIDPNTNKWKQSWAGSYANGVQEFINGEYIDSAMRFEFESKDAQGNKIIGRFIFYNQGPNQVRQFNETSNDEGKTWTTSYDFTYIRKK
ncbi:MAG TPA: tetratricopeptide repeat protein [Parafilimonas sp.]|jgi:tetratricopeptide (TPR) repeat protein